jgi:DNA-binding NarL/FixJ family response regulator
VVESAMRMGGHGYVAKTDAGSELLMAIRSVSAGEQFVSQRIVSQGWKLDRFCPGRYSTDSELRIAAGP